MSADAYLQGLTKSYIIMKCHWHSVYSRRRQSASSMANKHQSVDCREREALAMATKHQSADCREREAQAMASKRQSAEYREENSGYGYQMSIR